jgi:UDP-2,3-diacylglucosamine hydrolase
MGFYFISDLHLRSAKEPVAQYLEKFLKTIPQPGDTLVLGGDIFDLFVGNKSAFKDAFSGVLAAIEACATRSIKIFYAEGNHDFQLSGIFTHQDIKICDDAFALEINARKIWIAHGDRIDPEDYGYKLLRFTTRTFLVRALIWILPNPWLRAIGQWSSRQSRKYNSVERLSSARSQRTRNLFIDYAAAKWAEGFDWVLLGHSHLADSQINGQQYYINPGFSDELTLHRRVLKLE